MTPEEALRFITALRELLANEKARCESELSYPISERLAMYAKGRLKTTSFILNLVDVAGAHPMDPS